MSASEHRGTPDGLAPDGLTASWLDRETLGPQPGAESLFVALRPGQP
jgi:hypothetical protein